MEVMEQRTFERYSAYKDSGVEWLGAVPVDWQIKRFKHYFSSAMGETILAEDLVEDGEFPVFSATEGSEYFGRIETPRIRLKKGDIVIPARGNSIGFPKLVHEKSTCSQTTIYAKKLGVVNSVYAYYYLLGCKDFIFQFTQTAIPQITVEEVKNNVFLLPKLDLQNTIVNFLDKKTTQIDQAIAQKERMIELLKERKQIIIQNAVTKGLDANVKMKDSGVEWIGEIPEHWKLAKNKTLFQERNQPGNESLPLLTVSIHSAVSSKELEGEDNIRGKVRIEDKSNYKFVDVDDVVFNMMRAWQGAIGAVRVQGMVSPAYVVTKSNEKIDARFFEYQYRTEVFIQQMSRFSKGITDFRKRLYWDEFKQLLTILPPKKEQTEIVQHIEQQEVKFEKAISLQEKQITKLKEYKATLIDSAVTGKIKVC